MTPSNTLRITLAILCAAPLYLANCSSSSSSTGSNGGTSNTVDAATGDGDPANGDGDPATGDGDPAAGDGDPANGDGDPTTGDGDDDAGSAAGDGGSDTGDAAGGGDGDGGDPVADSGGGGGLGSACYTADDYGDSCTEAAEGYWTEANCGDPRDACPGGWFGKCTIGDNLSANYYYSEGAASLGQNACALGLGTWEDGEG